MSSVKSRKSDRASSGGYAYETFHRKRQLGRLAFHSLLRWLITVALVASIYGVLWHYSSKEAVPKSRKHVFNAIVSGLSIALGLNIASSLKAMMGELRWWVLSWRFWRPREADLILQSENISSLSKLLFKSRSFSVHVYVVMWIVINIASQIAIATLGLTYNVNSADTVGITKPGDVCVPDLSQIQTTKITSTKSHTTNALRYTANSYGNVALASGWGTMDQLPSPGIYFNPDNYLSFCNASSCTYVFYEATPLDLSYYSVVTSNRSVTVTTVCESWKVLRGGNGNNYTITIADEDRTEIDMPATYGTSQSMFIVNVDTDSGPDWARVAALEASTTDPWFYDCNVTIGSVVNAVLPVHNLSPNITSLAAPAIALQGYGASQIGANVTGDAQFQSYPAESFYGAPQNGSTEGMSALLSRFACGVIEVTAQGNSNVKAFGQQPIKAIKLEISHWEYVHLILGLTVGLQLLFAVVSLIVANRVVVRDRSPLSLSALLRPTMQELSGRAAFANEREIAGMFQPRTTMKYARGRGGTYEMEVSESGLHANTQYEHVQQ